MGSAIVSIALLAGGALCGAESSDGTIFPDTLTCERLSEPVGIDAAAPRLSWVNRAKDENAQNLSQSAYRVLAASSEAILAENRGDLWDSGWVTSNENLDIAYAGKPLETSRHIWWKVAVRDADGTESAWSAPARWVTGVMNPSDWTAKWIGQPESLRGKVNIDGASWIGLENGASNELFVRKEFTLDVSQSAFDSQEITALYRYAGNKNFELFVNDQKVGYSIGMVYNPDMLRAIDITAFLVPGKNTVSAKVWVDNREKEGVPAFFAKVDVQKLIPSEAGTPGVGTPGETILSVASDASWQARDRADGGYLGAKILYAADSGPWGKLRRFSEKTSPYFRKIFTLPEKKRVTEATLHITGLGFYEASLNGEKIGDQLLTPAPTKFDKTVLYSTYDVTDRLVSSSWNGLEVALGHGWYDVRSVATWNFDAAPWRDFPRMIAQLDVRYDDGSSERIISDESWECTTSPVVFDCIRQGEIVNGAWRSQVAYAQRTSSRPILETGDSSTQKPLGSAAVVDAPLGKLTAEAIPATKILREFPAQSVSEIAPGVWSVDLGENIAGWCRVKFHGLKKGQVVRLRYAERPPVDGAFNRHDIDQHFMEGSPAYYAGGKGGFQTDYYIARGEDGETFEPRFTYNGFQFVEVTGVDSAPAASDFTACFVGNSFPTTGSFACSNDLLNAIQAATLSSYRANFVNGYPTDCPHREKNGWTGDAQLACELAMFNFDNTACYEKWLRDLRDEQRENGNLPGIVPTGGWGYPWGNGPAWDSSMVLIPWFTYIYRGDRRILEENYDAMKKYVDYTTTRADYRFLVTHGLGDWVPVKTVTPVEVTSTGYWYADTKIVARAAELLGKTDDAAKYNALAEKIAAAFEKELAHENGVYSIGSQTSQSCAIYQGFVPNAERRRAAFDRLVEQVEGTDRFLDVGILGSKYLLRTLGEYGRNDLAIAMMLQEKQPCYADWLKRGGGTLWEDWGEGSSRNHIMFGDVSAWCYQYLAGIRLWGAPAIETAAVAPEADSAAFRHFLIFPRCRVSEVTVPGREPIRWVKSSVETVRGTVKSAWQWNDDFTELSVDVEVPVGCQASVFLPDNACGGIPCCRRVEVVGSGKHHFTVSQNIDTQEQEESAMTYDSLAPFCAKISEIKLDAPELARYPETVRRGIEWLQKTDLAALPLGRNEIDGDAIYANVQEYDSNPVEGFSVEAHRKYIDIQALSAGRELIGTVKLTDAMPVVEPYSAEKDCLFLDRHVMPFLLDGSDSDGRIILNAGELVIFTPSDPHAPSLAIDKPEKVRKIVVKCQAGK